VDDVRPEGHRRERKGIGESGAIGPPAAIVNAINDALAPLGAEVTDLPASPSRVLAAIQAARGAPTTGEKR